MYDNTFSKSAQEDHEYMQELYSQEIEEEYQGILDDKYAPKNYPENYPQHTLSYSRGVALEFQGE
jgi:hypothetical protein